VSNLAYSGLIMIDGSLCGTCIFSSDEDEMVLHLMGLRYTYSRRGLLTWFVSNDIQLVIQSRVV
jgi:hypothetical protein